MKLYTANLSPYASRVRLALYAKGLDFETPRPPGGSLKSPEYLALNPMGKAPCLVTDAGIALPESTVIVEYLEDAYPGTPLLPKGAEDRARARLVARIVEIYVAPPLGGLFGQLDPAKRDQAVADGHLDSLDEGLGYLDQHMASGAFALGADFSLADCVMVPTLFYVASIPAAFGRTDFLSKRKNLAGYLDRARSHPAVAKVLGEMTDAFTKYRETGQIS